MAAYWRRRDICSSRQSIGDASSSVLQRTTYCADRLAQPQQLRRVRLGQRPHVLPFIRVFESNLSKLL
jgi:hypothetical protein